MVGREGPQVSPARAADRPGPELLTGRRCQESREIVGFRNKDFRTENFVTPSHEKLSCEYVPPGIVTYRTRGRTSVLTPCATHTRLCWATSQIADENGAF